MRSLCAAFHTAVFSGRVRSLAVTCGRVRSRAVFRGLVDSCAVRCGRVRFSAVPCGRVRSSAVVCGRVRSCVRSCAVVCDRVRSCAISCGREQILLILRYYFLSPGMVVDGSPPAGCQPSPWSAFDLTSTLMEGGGVRGCGGRPAVVARLRLSMGEG